VVERHQAGIAAVPGHPYITRQCRVRSPLKGCGLQGHRKYLAFGQILDAEREKRKRNPITVQSVPYERAGQVRLNFFGRANDVIVQSRAIPMLRLFVLSGKTEAPYG